MLDLQLGEKQKKKELKIFKIGFYLVTCAHRLVFAYAGIMYVHVGWNPHVYELKNIYVYI